jgi:hypothetical protein
MYAATKVGTFARAILLTRKDFTHSLAVRANGC